MSAETTTTTLPPQQQQQQQQRIEAALPRVAIEYCTQCRWLLRAAYFAQELLTTFGTAIGEAALVPTTGGVFRVTLTYIEQPSAGSEANGSSAGMVPRETLLWDRKAEGGFPETKVLKQRVRDCIEPGRDLGHSDKPAAGGAEGKAKAEGGRGG